MISISTILVISIVEGGVIKNDEELILFPKGVTLKTGEFKKEKEIVSKEKSHYKNHHHLHVAKKQKVPKHERPNFSRKHLSYDSNLTCNTPVKFILNLFAVLELHTDKKKPNMFLCYLQKVKKRTFS